MTEQPVDEPVRLVETPNVRLSDLKAAQGPVQPTVIDNQGFERIIGPAIDQWWTPAKVHPDEDEIARVEYTREQHAKLREERLNATQVSAEASAAGGAGDVKAAKEAE